jgi:translation initiation factor 2A
VYNVPSFNSPISQKTFFKGDKVQLKWNGLGTSLIVLAQTDVDKSNKSYYGETTMYLLSANGSFDARITLDKEGPIHDVAWSPNSTEFGVVYGYMPAKTTIFNHRGVAVHSFPIGPRNTIIFSPTGRFALVAGFGNLAGQIDVYDLEKDYRKICTIESGNPSVCTWSPDSRYILTATTSPRLRVDNGIKLWHVGGGIMYNEEMVELYNVMWRPIPAGGLPANLDPLHPVPTPHPSALAYLGTVKTPSKPVGAYRPPGARGSSTPLHFKREDEGGAAHTVSNGIPSIGPNGFGRPRHMVPGAEPVVRTVPGADPANEAGGQAKKNKKKRSKKAKEGDANATGAAAGGAGGGAPTEGGLAPSPREYGSGSGTEGRSPDRRGQHQHHARSRSRNNNTLQPGGGGVGNGQRNRSNTHRNRSRSRPGHAGQQQGQQQQQGGGAPIAHAGAAAAGAGVEEGAGAGAGAGGAAANPNAKKIRALQKKIRAIEDLEMRRAGGEKLEDTQVKKIATKESVLLELAALERGTA